MIYVTQSWDDGVLDDVDLHEVVASMPELVVEVHI